MQNHLSRQQLAPRLVRTSSFRHHLNFFSPQSGLGLFKTAGRTLYVISALKPQLSCTATSGLGSHFANCKTCLKWPVCTSAVTLRLQPGGIPTSTSCTPSPRSLCRAVGLDSGRFGRNAASVTRGGITFK